VHRLVVLVLITRTATNALQLVWVAAKACGQPRAMTADEGQWLSVCHIFTHDCETSIGKDLTIACAQRASRQPGGQIRPGPGGSQERLVPAPPGDRGMIA